MPVSLLHEVYLSQFVYSGPTTLTLNQIEQVDVQPGIELLEAMGAGSVDPLLIATAFAEPKVDFTCRDVSTILGGVSITQGREASTSAKLQFQKRLHGGDYTSGSNHVSLTATGGLLYPKEISAKQDAKEGASISLTFCPVWDGTNLPLVVNTAQALTGTVAANAVHALGPVVFQGAQLGGVQSISVKTGIEVMFKRQDGELFSRIVTIVKRRPIIEIELLNVPFIATPTIGGTAPLTSTAYVYLQKVTAGGGRVAIATAEHIALSAAAGTYRIESLGGSRGDNANVKLIIDPTGTLAMSAASAITIP